MISNGFNAVFQSECMQCRTLGKGSRFDFFDTAGNGNAGQRIVSSEGNTPQLREGTGKLYLAQGHFYSISTSCKSRIANFLEPFWKCDFF